MTLSLTPRWVTGIPAAAGTAATDETPEHDLDVDSCLRHREGFLAAAPVDERIAALQPYDRLGVARELDEECVDRLLRQAVTGDHECVVRRLLDELRRDEPVVHERVAAADQLEPACGDQTRVAGACADQIHGHASASSSTARK